MSSIAHLCNGQIANYTISTKQINTMNSNVVDNKNNILYSFPSVAPDADYETIVINKDGSSSFQVIPNMRDINALEEAISVPTAGTLENPSIIIDAGGKINMNQQTTFNSLVNIDNGININNGSSIALISDNSENVCYINMNDNNKLYFSNALQYLFNNNIIIDDNNLRITAGDIYIAGNPTGLQAQINNIGSTQYAQYENSSDIVLSTLANSVNVINWSTATYNAIGSTGFQFSSGYLIANDTGSQIKVKCDLSVSVMADVSCSVYIQIAEDGSYNSQYGSTTALSANKLFNINYSKIFVIDNGHYIISYIVADQNTNLTIKNACLNVVSL